MEIPQDERFREERVRYNLKWNCEDCARYRAQSGCAHGYPVERHLRARYDDPTASLLFCKDFELR